MDLSLVIVIVCVVVAAALIAVFVIFGRSEANFTFDIGGASPRASGGSDSSAEKTSSSRLVGLAVLVGAAFTALVGRLYDLHAVPELQIVFSSLGTSSGGTEPKDKDSHLCHYRHKQGRR